MSATHLVRNLLEEVGGCVSDTEEEYREGETDAENLSLIQR